MKTRKAELNWRVLPTKTGGPFSKSRCASNADARRTGLKFTDYTPEHGWRQSQKLAKEKWVATSGKLMNFFFFGRRCETRSDWRERRSVASEAQAPERRHLLAHNDLRFQADFLKAVATPPQIGTQVLRKASIQSQWSIESSTCCRSFSSLKAS